MAAPVLSLGVLEQADGSARLLVGRTDILVAVHGPSPVRTRQERTDGATLQVSVDSVGGPPGLQETAMAHRLEQILAKLVLTQLHPRSLVSVAIQPIALDGAVLAAMVNASVAALIDAGIPLRRTVTAVGGALLEDGQLVLAPSGEQERAAPTSLLFLFDGHAQTDEALACDIVGPVALERLAVLRKEARGASAALFARLSEAVRRRQIIDRVALAS